MYITTNLHIHSTVEEHQSCFDLLAIVNNDAILYKHDNSSFTSLGYIPRNGIIGSYNSMFNYFKNCTIFHSTCSILHVPQQCKRNPVSPYPCQHSSSSCLPFFFSDRSQELCWAWRQRKGERGLNCYMSQ